MPRAKTGGYAGAVRASGAVSAYSLYDMGLEYVTKEMANCAQNRG